MTNPTAKRFSMRRFLTHHLGLWAFVMTSIPAVLVYYDSVHEVDELFDASLVQTAKVLNGLISREALANSKEHLIDSMLAKDVQLLVGDEHHPYEKKLYFQIWDDTGLVIKSKEAPDIAFGHFEEGFHELHAEGFTWLTFAIYSEHDKWWLVLGERQRRVERRKRGRSCRGLLPCRTRHRYRMFGPSTRIH